MTHSRQRKYTGDLPPDVRALIAKYGGVIIAAERAAGIGIRTFGKIRAGKRNYTDELKRRVQSALNPQGDIPAMAKPSLTIPDSCPPLLKRFLEHVGTKERAVAILRASRETINKIIDGRGELPAAWIAKIKAELGESVIGAPREETSAAQPVVQAGPEFVLWDGKAKGTLELQGNGKHRARKMKNVPQPIIDLVVRHGTLTAAAKVLGSAIGTISGLAEGTVTFTEKWQRKVHAATHGLVPPKTTMGEEFDKYSLGIAICLVKGANFDRIADIADILMAKMVFRKNTTSGWILIYRMADEDLPKFKKLALRDANEIVCP